MPEDVTLQSQVDGLVRAMRETQTLRTAAGAAREPRPESRPEGDAKTDRPAVPPADKPTNKPPAELDPVLAEAFGRLHAPLARQWAETLAPRLRIPVTLEPHPPQGIRYREWVAGLTLPGCFHMLTAHPLAGQWLIEIERPLADAMIDRMLGGDADSLPTVPRPLTEIETKLIGRVVGDWLGPLKQSWRAITELDFRIDRAVSDPRQASVRLPDQAVAVLPWEVVFGNRSGRVRLVIPLTPLQPWMARLTEPRDADRPDDEIDPPASRPTAEREQALVDVVVTLARSKIRTRDLFDLEVGDLITTEQDVTAPLELSLQGVPKFTVHAGAMRGNKAVRIEGLITE